MKFIRIFLFVLIVVGIVLLFTQKFWVSPLVEWIMDYQDNSKMQSVEIPKNTDSNQNDTFDTLNINPSEIKSFGNINPVIFSNNKNSISFKGTVAEARNPGSHVYLNESSLGTVEGQGVVNASFSKDNRWFTFSIISICGADCVHKRDYQIDLISSTLK